jgi:hypothetical protein
VSFELPMFLDIARGRGARSFSGDVTLTAAVRRQQQARRGAVDVDVMAAIGIDQQSEMEPLQ